MTAYRISALLLSLCFFLIGCTKSQHVDTEAEAVAVRNIESQWAAAIKGKDVDKIMDIISPEAVAIDADGPNRSDPQSIRKAYETWLADPTVSSSYSSQVDTVEVSAAGDLAYSRGRSQWRQNTSEGRVLQASRFVTIYRKVNGRWKVIVDIGASEKPTRPQ